MSRQLGRWGICRRRGRWEEIIGGKPVVVDELLAVSPSSWCYIGRGRREGMVLPC